MGNCTLSSSLQKRLQEQALLHGQYNIIVLCEAVDVAQGTF